MTLDELKNIALEIRKKYKTLEVEKYGRPWTKDEIMAGLVGDIGDLAKLTLAAKGIRDIPNHHEKIGHELSDCLWSIFVLAHEYDIDLEKHFIKTMNDIDQKINAKK